MSLKISVPALTILHQLQSAGYEAYIVGGAVRDLLLADKGENSQVMDYDFTTNALPEQIQIVFPDSFYENSFGTVSVPHNYLSSAVPQPADTSQDKPRVIDVAQASKLHPSLSLPPEANSVTESQLDSEFPHYQITTFRSDEVYDDFRRPSSMTWGKTLTEDLDRRDFTINAMAIHIKSEILERILTDQTQSEHQLAEDEYQLIDPHHGQLDLTAHLIRTVGAATTRFQEDALRMLRAIRFAVQLNMSIDETTFVAIQQHGQLVTNISGERIRDELLKMLKTNYPAEAIELLDTANLLPYFLPELLATKGVVQGGHHTTDVWTHSLDALRYCPSTDPVVRLATLLHDIAKPQTQAITPETITFYNHEVVGARTARSIAQRLRLSKKDVDRIFTLVRFHMFYYQPHNTDASIRRFMRKVGLANIDDILDLREGDRLGSGARKTSWRLEEMKQRMMEQLHQPLDVTDLALNGHDLMTELELKPGPEIGRILNSLFELVLDQPELNQRQSLLQEARTLAANASPTPPVSQVVPEQK